MMWRQMNKYSVILSSRCNGATMSIQFLVNSNLSSKQLATYYTLKSNTIIDVYVEALDT